jgi:RNA polymerase sigma-70 factor (ECF subfamily)
LAPPRPATDSPLPRRLHALARNLVWKLLGPDPELEDVVQEACARIIQGLPQLRSLQHFEGWATRVTVNTVHEELRRRRIRRCVSFVPDPGQELVAWDDPQSHRAARAVSGVLDRLSESERTLLQLRWFEDATVDDIARRDGCSLRTVRRRMQRALRRFETLAARKPELASWLVATRPPGESSAPVPNRDALQCAAL